MKKQKVIPKILKCLGDRVLMEVEASRIHHRSDITTEIIENDMI